MLMRREYLTGNTWRERAKRPAARVLSALLVGALAWLVAAPAGSADGFRPGALAARIRALDAGRALLAGDHVVPIPGWSDRPAAVHLPGNYTSAIPVPVVIALHAAGETPQEMAVVTCPNGDPASPGCLNALADRELFAVVYPTSGAMGNTWNAGGGTNGFECVQGAACAAGLDDVSYVRDVLQEVQTQVNVDPARVFVTGYSNGAALAHRLGCELGDRIAAIAPVAGVNQYAATASCAPARPVAVIEFHGTDDQISLYDGGQGAADTGIRVSVPATIDGWAARNGCGQPSTTALADTVADGTTVTRTSYTGCGGADVVLYTVNGGGHTWPGGWKLPDVLVGATTSDISANDLMWDFFRSHARAGAQATPFAAALPGSRSVMVGTPATAFATVINPTGQTASAVGISLATQVPADFAFRTTDPSTNQATGAPNTPVDIPPGQSRTFVIAVTPRAAFAATDLAFSYAGANTLPAPTLPGINTLLLSASNTPVPDVVALAATLGNNGIVDVPGGGIGVFSVATVNLGVGGTIRASADTGSAAIPATVTLCQTNPATGACISPIQSTVEAQINTGETPTFGVFVRTDGIVAFDPGVNRVYVRFRDGGDVTRGATSVAIRRQQ
jgi:polyhydroxybutyrate depolymerase